MSQRMSLNKLHQSIVLGWLGVVVAAIAVRVGLGATPVSLSEALAWLMAGAVPTLVMLSVFRGAPRTTGQMLRDLDQLPASPKPAAPRLEK